MALRRHSFFATACLVTLCCLLAFSFFTLAAADTDTVTGDDAVNDVINEIGDDDDDGAGALDEDADLARYNPDVRHPLSVLPPASSDLRVAYSVVSGLTAAPADPASAQITLGTEVKVVLSASNAGSNLFKVWGIMGSLNRPDNFAVHIQNFSYSLVNYTIAENEEISATYRFTPNEGLDVRPFQLAITIFYEAVAKGTGNAITGHSTTFFNATVVTKPGPQIVSNSVFMLFFVIFVAAVAAAAIAYKKSVEQQENQKDSSVASRDSSAAAVKDAKPTDASKNEWLEGALGMNKPGSGKAKRKAKDKKK